MRLAAILLLIVFLVGCTPSATSDKAQKLAEELREQGDEEAKDAVKETEQTAPDVNSEQEIAEEPQAPAQPKPETAKTAEPQTVESSEQEMSVTAPEDIPVNEPEPSAEAATENDRTIVAELFQTFTTNVSGYTFIYEKDKYVVKGNKYKIVLDEPVRIRGLSLYGERYNLFYYDTIYVNRENETAIAYCEGVNIETSTQCEQLNLYDIPYEVPFKDYTLVLPEDWLHIYMTEWPRNLARNKYYVEGREVLRFDVNGTELYVDEKLGLPMRVDQRDTGVLHRHEYRKLSANTVRDVDVIHRNRDEIPTDEPFYSNRP